MMLKYLPGVLCILSLALVALCLYQNAQHQGDKPAWGLAGFWFLFCAIVCGVWQIVVMMRE